MLDELIEQAIALPPNDNNIYTYGRIKIAGSNASHVVAIAQLPLSTTGKASAATVANNMRRTFPNLKFGIMVGIAGGVWTTDVDVRLGDIVVGVPDDGGPGIIQYDHGKALQERELVLKGSLNKAPDLLRSAAGLLKRKHMRKPGEYVSFLNDEEVKRHAPRPDVDNLFSALYVHQGGKSCEDCDKAHLRNRSHRTDLTPKVHYGAIASGDQVVKDAVFAEKIRRTHNIMCFEMEAAGLDAFPCIVVRGISDYADTHKNDDWHAYAAGTAAAYAKELLSLVPLTAVAELPSTGNTHWNVPRAPNLMFTGRQHLLDSLKDHLVTAPEKKDRSVFVLQGIGGAGKSEVAIKFATENQDSFWGIFWIDADNRQSIEQGFAEIARLQTPPLKETTPRDVTKWLATTKESWLLILDNCDDAELDFAKFIPSRGGSIIITTRLVECRNHGTWENIDELGPENAVQLLLRASGLHDGDQTTVIPAAKSVISILGEHALALVHAGAYIKKGHCTLSEYVQLFRDEQNRLMKFKPEQQASRYGSVYTTFEVSAKALTSSDRHDSHLALKLLGILAFMNREAVEEDVFTKAFDACHELESEHRFAWEEKNIQWFERCAISNPENGSLYEHQDEIKNLDGPEITADVLCSCKGGYRHIALSEAAQSMPADHEIFCNAKSPTGDRKYPSSIVQATGSPDCLRVVHDSERHFTNIYDDKGHKSSGPGHPGIDENNETSEICEDYCDDAEIYHLGVWHCHQVRSSGLVDRQRSRRLRAACIRLADLSLIRFDNSKISMHPLVHGWALIRLSEASRQHAWEQTLSILALSSWKPEWPIFVPNMVQHMDSCFRNLYEKERQSKLSLNTARALYHLANLYSAHRKFEQSLAIIETLLSSYEVQPLTWSFKNSVLLRTKAACLKALGRLEEMQNCVHQIAHSTNRWFEPDSPAVYDSRILLAETQMTAGNFEDAIEMLEALRERNSRTSVLSDLTMKNLLQTLSRAHQSLGNHEQTVLFLSEELKITERLYPPHHPYLLDTLDRLGESYITIDSAERAVTLLVGIVDMKPQQMTRTRGPWRLGIMSTLARAYEELHEHYQATMILEQMHAQCSEALVTDDPLRITIMHRLAMAYIKQDKPSQAAPLLEDVVEIGRTNLPLNDSGRLNGMNRLADVYLDLKQPQKAVKLLEEIVGIEAWNLPSDDARRLLNMDRLAEAHIRSDKPSRAVPLTEHVVAMERDNLAEDDVSRLRSVRRLARAYTELVNKGNVHEAISLLEEVMDKGRKTLHADPEELIWTEELQANAQKKLRQSPQQQPLVGLEEEQETPVIAAETLPDSTIFGVFRRFTRRAAMMF